MTANSEVIGQLLAHLVRNKLWIKPMGDLIPTNTTKELYSVRVQQLIEKIADLREQGIPVSLTLTQELEHLKKAADFAELRHGMGLADKHQESSPFMSELLRPLSVEAVTIKWEPDSYYPETYLQCKARAVVRYQAAEMKDGKINGFYGPGECFTSIGEFEIHPDISPADRREIEDHELTQLADHLGHFGIATTASELRVLVRENDASPTDLCSTSRCDRGSRAEL